MSELFARESANNGRQTNSARGSGETRRQRGGDARVAASGNDRRVRAPVGAARALHAAGTAEGDHAPALPTARTRRLPGARAGRPALYAGRASLACRIQRPALGSYRRAPPDPEDAGRRYRRNLQFHDPCRPGGHLPRSRRVTLAAAFAFRDWVARPDPLHGERQDPAGGDEAGRTAPHRRRGRPARPTRRIPSPRAPNSMPSSPRSHSKATVSTAKSFCSAWRRSRRR